MKDKLRKEIKEEGRRINKEENREKRYG